MAGTPSPFRITVYDRNLERVGWIGSPISATFTPRFNAQGTGTVVVRPNDKALEYLVEPGCRLGVTYRGEHLMSGAVWGVTGSLLDDEPVTVQLRDDWMLTNALAFVDPEGAIAPRSLEDLAQAVATGPTTSGTVANQAGYYRWPTATSREAAIKALLLANLRDRLGINIEAAPNLGRGGAPGRLPQVRMTPLNEVLATVLEAGQLGLRVWQAEEEQRLTLDVFTPDKYPRRLTARSGIVRAGSWSLNPPSATRAVAGGPGELAARAFWSTVDAQLEADWGTVLEKLKDATSAKMEWGDLAEALRVAKYYALRPEVPVAAKAAFIDTLEDAAAEVLAEGRATSSLSAELSETKSFHFGGPDGVHLGDELTIRAQGIDFTERITEATLTLEASGEFTATPRLGERKDDPTRTLARSIATLARSQRRAAAAR